MISPDHSKINNFQLYKKENPISFKRNPSRLKVIAMVLRAKIIQLRSIFRPKINQTRACKFV